MDSRHQPQVPVLAISQPSMDVPVQRNDFYQSSPNSQNQQWNNQQFFSEPVQMDLQQSQETKPIRPTGYQQMGETFSNLSGLSSSSSNKGSDYGSPHFALDSSPRPSTANPQSYQSPQPPKRAPTRDDSYDRLKQFLGFSEIDVEGNQPTTIMGGVRKRSLSDIGPRPSEFFGVGGKDQEMEKMLLGGNMGQGLSFMDSPNDMSWMDDGLREKLGHRDLNGIGGRDFMNSNPTTTVMAMHHYQSSSSPSNSTTSGSSASPNNAGVAVDPTLLGGGGISDRQSPNSMMGPTVPSNGYSSASPSGGLHHRNGSVGASPISNSPNWMGNQNLSSSPRPSTANQRRGHKRGAQSEDLRSSIKQEGMDDFLAQITAPNGGLAPPPGVTSGIRNSISPPSPSSPTNLVSTIGGGGHGRGAGSQAPPFFPSNSYHPYRPSSSHARHSSFGSNHSNSSIREELLANQRGDPSFNSNSSSSMMMPPHPAHHQHVETPTNNGNVASSNSKNKNYNQTSLPTYGGLGSDKDGQPGQGQLPASNYVNAKVTTEKTQQASAMRRKTEAMYACPVAGCTSTFTR